jgi:hypothetical protein
MFGTLVLTRHGTTETGPGECWGTVQSSFLFLTSRLFRGRVSDDYTTTGCQGPGRAWNGARLYFILFSASRFGFLILSSSSRFDSWDPCVAIRLVAGTECRVGWGGLLRRPVRTFQIDGSPGFPGVLSSSLSIMGSWRNHSTDGRDRMPRWLGRAYTMTVFFLLSYHFIGPLHVSIWLVGTRLGDDGAFLQVCT